MDDRSEPISRRRREHRGSGLSRGLLALLAFALLGLAWWRLAEPGRDLEATAVAEHPLAEMPAALPPEPAAGQSEPEPHYPLEPAADESGRLPLAPEADAELPQLVEQWLGRDKSMRFVAMDEMARRIVATVDNLPRAQAPSSLWPLLPVGGRMMTESTEAGLQISPGNAARYQDLVGFVTGIDPASALAVYKRIYPVLQRNYEALGYPGRQFNDRLVAVIDHLLKTPDIDKPLLLTLVQVQGEVASQRPWLRYEYATPELEALSAGQKILLRMGRANAQRVKTMLRTVRMEIAPPRP